MLPSDEKKSMRSGHTGFVDINYEKLKRSISRMSSATSMKSPRSSGMLNSVRIRMPFRSAVLGTLPWAVIEEPEETG